MAISLRPLVIGSNSFIGRSLSKFGNLTSCGHAAPNLPDLVASHDMIINCALHPALRDQPYDVAWDLDTKLATSIEGSGKKLVILSSRTVYGHVATPMHEDMPLKPASVYSTNKARIEDSCRDLLGDNLLVLRMSNIFGFEWPSKPGRLSFMSQVLSSLKDRHMMTFDIAARSEKDFLPVHDAARIIYELCLQGTTGTINLAAGQSLTMSDVTDALRTGFGAGKADFQSDRLDSFFMNISKLKETGISLPQPSEILREFEAIGRKLAGSKVVKIS